MQMYASYFRQTLLSFKNILFKKRMHGISYSFHLYDVFLLD